MRSTAIVLAALFAVGCSGGDIKKQPVGGSCVPQSDPHTAPDCADNFCLAIDSATGVCTKSCADDPTACPTGFSCELRGSYGRICLKATGCATDDDCPAGHVCDLDTKECYIKVSRSLCSPCEDDAQCPVGGACFTALGSSEKFCTTPCDNNQVCPDGYVCENLPAEGSTHSNGVTNQCVPKSESCDFGKGLCAPCRGDNECGGALDLCVRNVVSGEQFCGTQCSPDAGLPCPDNFTCEDLKLNGEDTPGPFQCVPNSNSCVGYCDSSDAHVVLEECGLGKSCDTDAKQCVAASDGRQCAPCQTNDDCQKPDHPNNLCLVNDSVNSDAHGETFCAEPCPATGGDALCLSDLGPGFICSAVGNEHFCTPSSGSCSKGLGRLGDDCSQNEGKDCVTGVCLVAGINNLSSICSATCAADSDCGDSRFRCCDWDHDSNHYDCSARNQTNTGPASGSGVCAPPGGSFGDDCSAGRPPCTSGQCLDLGTAQLCSESCGSDGDCPPDFACETATDSSTGEDSSVCFPKGGGVVGSDCTFGPAACSDRLCIKKESGNECTKECSDASDCPDGYSCALHIVVGQTDQKQVCLPAGVE